MGDIIITILNGDPATGTLTMSDQGVTNVIQGDQVTWQIAKPTGTEVQHVFAITGIKEKPMSFDLFNPDPKPWPNPDSKDWQGTINPNIGDNEEETYSIEWVTNGGGGWLGKDNVPKSFDPTIKIKPSGK